MNNQVEDIIELCEHYEIHPGHKGGFLLVSVRSSEATASFSTAQEARNAWECECQRKGKE